MFGQFETEIRFEKLVELSASHLAVQLLLLLLLPSLHRLS